MITTEQTAEILAAKLNALAEKVTEQPFRFLIHSNEGDYKSALVGSQKKLPIPYINGVLLEVMSTPVPLQGLNSVVKQETLQLLIPVDTSRVTGRIDYAMNLLTAFVQDVVGLSGSIADSDGNKYSYVLGISTPMTGVETYCAVESGIAVPVTLSVAWQFIENGVLSNDTIFSLNGTPVILMDGSLVRTRVGDTNNIDGAEEMSTVITQQGLTAKIVLPYKRGDVSQTLMSDLLDGALGTIYTFKYDDGVLTKTYQMVAKEITSSHNAGKGVTITATLEIARQ